MSRAGWCQFLPSFGETIAMISSVQMSFPLQFLRAQAGGKLETAPKIDAFLNRVEAMESYKVAMEKGGLEFSLNF